MMRDQANLIQRMMEGDSSCFDDIIAWYAQDVLRLCVMLLGDRDEAKDILQEILLRLLRTAKTGKLRLHNGSIKGFLLTVARNLCVDKLKKRKNFYSLNDEQISERFFISPESTPNEALDEIRFQNIFHRQLAQLSDIQRTIFVLRKLKGDSFKEIAATLCISVDSAKKHFYRALGILRILLKPYVE